MNERYIHITNSQGYHLPHEVIRELVRRDEARLTLHETLSLHITAFSKKIKHIAPQDEYETRFWKAVEELRIHRFTQLSICIFGSGFFKIAYNSSVIGNTGDAFFLFAIGLAIIYGALIKARYDGFSSSDALRIESLYNNVMKINGWKYKIKPDVLERLNRWKTTIS